MRQDKLRERLRLVREKEGINYKHFAKELSMEVGSFYNFACGTRQLSVEKEKLLEEQLEKYEI